MHVLILQMIGSVGALSLLFVIMSSKFHNSRWYGKQKKIITTPVTMSKQYERVMKFMSALYQVTDSFEINFKKFSEKVL